MPESSPQSQPITETDLALYAEDRLAVERRGQVDEFVRIHPELRDFLDIPFEADVDSSLCLEVTGPDFPLIIRLPSESRGRLGRWIIATIAAALVMGAGISVFFSERAAAANLPLRRLQQEIDEGNVLRNADEIHQAKLDLEGINDFYLSIDSRLLRDVLLSRVYLAEAEQQAATLSFAPLPFDYRTNIALLRCRQAIDLLKPQATENVTARDTLAHAWWLLGQIEFRLAATAPFHTTGRTTGMNAAAFSMLNSLTLLSGKTHAARRILVAALLLKAFQKGAITKQFGVLPHPQQEILARTVSLLPEFNLDLRASPPEIVDELAAGIMNNTVPGDEALLGRLQAANVMTMRCRSSLSEWFPEANEQSVSIAEEAIAEIEAHDELLQYPAFQLVTGRLLGNLADSLHMSDLAASRDAGYRALNVFRKLVADYRHAEYFEEQAWVTARLLISEYQFAALNVDTESNVEGLLWALLQTEGDLQNAAALQLTDWEIELIRAIDAEVSGEPSRAVGASAIHRTAKQTPGVRRVLARILPAFRSNIIFKSDSDFLATLLLLQNEPLPP